MTAVSLLIFASLSRKAENILIEMTATSKKKNIIMIMKMIMITTKTIIKTTMATMKTTIKKITTLTIEKITTTKNVNINVASLSTFVFQ